MGLLHGSILRTAGGGGISHAVTKIFYVMTIGIILTRVPVHLCTLLLHVNFWQPHCNGLWGSASTSATPLPPPVLLSMPPFLPQKINIPAVRIPVFTYMWPDSVKWLLHLCLELWRLLFTKMLSVLWTHKGLWKLISVAIVFLWGHSDIDHHWITPGVLKSILLKEMQLLVHFKSQVKTCQIIVTYCWVNI